MKSTVSSQDTLFPENHSSALHKVIHESVEEESLKEIAAGLESSGHQFIWVVRRNKKSREDKEDCLPQGFEERMEGKGLIIRGRALQVLILDHEAIVKEWLRVHGDHVRSEAVEKTITQIMSSGAKKRPGRLLKKVDLLTPISIL
ncbi:hypothetical protein POTOM_013189 [Populus tomentosa]|uniref:Uncharacterized protein n=1 Tax=Populus tomentosa TaxID=118781 RepID=A0A8X8D768_POPTO|nr:hypothetical protein POTOM_013189 [Populus tomentosa]